MEFDIDENGFLFLQTKDRCGLEETFWSIQLATPLVPAEYCYGVFPMDGTFCVDDMNGQMIYAPDPQGGTATCPCSDCDVIPVTCLSFCEKISGYQTIENVISASTRTFSDTWKYDPATAGTWILEDNPNIFRGGKDNVYQRGEGGKWRLLNVFGYSSDIKSATVGNAVYDNAGIFVDEAGSPTEAFVSFNWSDQSVNDQTKWLSSTTVTQYSSSGEVVEEHNALNVYSAATFSHENIVAGMVSANAEYSSIGFESFEERVDATGAFEQEITDLYAHSGKRSYLLDNTGTPSDPLLSFTVGNQIINDGLLIKLWVKTTYGSPAPPGSAPFAIVLDGNVYQGLADEAAGTLQPDLIHKIAQTGEWTLYQFIKNDYTAPDEGTVVELTISQALSSTESVWVDDLVVHSLSSQVVCFVYDPNTLRLVAKLDDQHFASYYLYNGEGKLVRSVQETERGVMTVAESQYHSPSEPLFPFVASTVSGSGSPSSIRSISSPMLRESSGSGADFQLLDFKIGPDGTKLSTFGSLKPSFPDLGSVPDLNLPEISQDDLKSVAPDLPELERVRLLNELMEIGEKQDQLREQARDADDAARIQLKKQSAELNRQRIQILRDKLGMSEEEVEKFYTQLQENSSAGSQENTDVGE